MYKHNTDLRRLTLGPPPSSAVISSWSAASKVPYSAPWDIWCLPPSTVRRSLVDSPDELWILSEELPKYACMQSQLYQSRTIIVQTFK
jgi:hypothetical protein